VRDPALAITAMIKSIAVHRIQTAAS